MVHKAAGGGSKVKTPREKIDFWKNVSSKVGREGWHTQIASQCLTRQLIFLQQQHPEWIFINIFLIRLVGFLEKTKPFVQS